MSQRAPKIAVSGLRKSFGPKIVLDGVEIACNTGESLVIIGGSGTGKSVLIKCVIDPESGRIPDRSGSTAAKRSGWAAPPATV